MNLPENPFKKIEKVAVIGSGVMGSGIAAHIANSGTPVLLLDIPAKGIHKNELVDSAVQKLKKQKPAPLMHPKNARLIETGNLEDDLDKLATCDWIIEVVIERLDIKRSLYKNIIRHCKKTCIISSNTSTLPLKDLTEELPMWAKKNFMITHFFNPPRYLRLLEIVSSEDTDMRAVKLVEEFADKHLGKSIVHPKDRPGFIANRIGTYWLHAAVTKAIQHGIDVEAADAVLSKPAGVPKTGVFGLIDLVGLDLMPHILDSFEVSLMKTDPFNALGKTPPLLSQMIKDGYTGRKGKGGFYRINKINGKKVKEVINLLSGDYHKAKRPKVKAALAAKKGGLKATLTHHSKEGAYAFDVLVNTLYYAASLLPEISDSLEEVDRAMRLGYNWKKGPFELIDNLGTAWFTERLTEHGKDIPEILDIAKGRPFYKTGKNGRREYLTLEGSYKEIPHPKGVLLLADIKRQSKPLLKNMSASVWDIGDGIACLEFTSKMNALNPFIIHMLNKARKELPKRGFKGLVIYNEGTNFSVGANIMLLLISAKFKLWWAINHIVKHGQESFMDMRHGDFPVVGAPSGLALGGGCEILLHCHAVEAHAETYIGLVEAGVGIIPGWGGCKELLRRAAKNKKTPHGPMPPVMKAFETIAMAKVATSATEAQDMLFFRKTDGITMNRDRLLANAKQRVLSLLAEGFTAPQETPLILPGFSGKTALELAVVDFKNKGAITPHDATVGMELATVLSGGDTDMTTPLSERELLKLERAGLIRLTKTKQTYARIKHMLFKGKPLRN